MLVVSHTLKTKFVFLKKSLLSSKASSSNVLHSFRVCDLVLWKRQRSLSLELSSDFSFFVLRGGTLFSPVAFDAMVVVPGILLRGRGFVVGIVPRDCRTGFLTPCRKI